MKGIYNVFISKTEQVPYLDVFCYNVTVKYSQEYVHLISNTSNFLHFSLFCGSCGSSLLSFEVFSPAQILSIVQTTLYVTVLVLFFYNFILKFKICFYLFLLFFSVFFSAVYLVHPSILFYSSFYSLFCSVF